MNKTVSLLASTVIENIEHRCKFEPDGCNVKMPKTEVEGHKKSCNFRPVDCPSCLCKEKVPFKHVVDHILNKCQYSFSKEAPHHVLNSQSMFLFYFPVNKFASASFKVTAYKWNDQFFFLNLKAINKLHIQFYVQMLGTEEDCKKYTVEIYLEDETGKRAITFCDNPLPIEISGEDLKAGGIHVSHTMAKKICYPSVGEESMSGITVWLTFAMMGTD